MYNKCCNCYYHNACCETQICDNYIPLDDSSEDIATDRLIEQGRQEFYKEWIEYLSKNDD